MALSHIDLFNKYASDDIKEKVELQCKKNKEIDLEKLKKLKDQIIKNAKALGEVNEKNIAEAWAYSYQKTVVKKINTSEEGKDLCYDCQHFKRCQKRKDDEALGLVTTVCNKYKSIKDLKKAELSDVLDVWSKYFPNIDKERIRLRLAHYICNEIDTDSLLWIIEIARSSQAKSTLSKPMGWCPHTVTANDLTSRSLFSGATDGAGDKVDDLGLELQNRRRVMYVPETATIKSLGSHGLQKLFAQFKNLYDQFVSSRSGSSGKKEYENMHTSVWMNSTPELRRYQTAMNIAGTCFLFYEVDRGYEDDFENAIKSVKNSGKYTEMMSEIREVTQRFLAHHHFIDFELSDEEYEWIANQSIYLSRMRTVGNYDPKGELISLPAPEDPSRIAKQLSVTYKALVAIGLDKDTAKTVVEKLVESSADDTLVTIILFLRMQIRLMKEGKKSEFDANFAINITSVIGGTTIGRYTIKRRLELLVGLKVLIKSYQGNSVESNPIYKLNTNLSDREWQIFFKCDKPTLEEDREDLYDDIRV